jgi:lipoate-protein ligase A
MSDLRIVRDDGAREPRLNLARDEALARHVAADPAATAPVLRLWRNAPCVVVGRAQLAWAEVDLAAAAALGAPVLRRFTGGGTVWHDEGNLNVSLVVRPNDVRIRADRTIRSVPGVYRLVLEPLASAARALGVATARATERDIVSAGGKLSGVAAWIGGGAILVHATLLVNADLDALARVCSGPGAPGNERWERTKSRRVRVTSLAREVDALPGKDAVDDAVIGAFLEGAAGAEGPGPSIVGPWRRSSAGWLATEIAEAQRLLRERYGDPAWHAVTPGA